MKTRLLFNTAALLGAIAVLWMALDFIGSNALALAVTVVIGFVYVLGLLELVQFRSATGSLRKALDSAGQGSAATLDDWLGHIHPSLRNSVAQRIQGERVGLPAPVFSPYLVGLLVMLGLLGTFIGMVDTLQGAVTALEGSTELSAIRAGLAAPIQGLGLAFGTSVAGVAASAMLGLNATLSRRERMQVTRQLDTCAGTVFREHSLQYNRQQTYLAMQGQAEALPRVADQLTAMAGELERTGSKLAEQLRENQEKFHAEAREQYSTLAESVGASMRESLAQSGRLAGESIAPAVEQVMAQLSKESSDTHKQLLAANQSHLAEVAQALNSSTADMTAALKHSSGELTEAARGEARGLVEEIGKLLASTETLVEARAANEADWQEQQGQRLATLTAALREELGSLRAEEQRRTEQLAGELASLQQSTSENLQALQGSASDNLEKLHDQASVQLSRLESSAVEQLGKLNSNTSEQLEQLNSSTSRQLEQLNSSMSEQLGQLNSSASEQLANLEASAAQQLLKLGSELEQPMLRLIETASETPKAAAEVIGRLREEISNSLLRDNELLEERQSLMQELAGLSTALQAATEGQRASVTEFLESSTGMLQSTSEEFRKQLSGEATRLADMTANVAGSAVEMASLGESFGLAVQLFSESNQSLVENLSRIEESMEKSNERSDEQMSYYVAQAREIIDQSMLSQREIIEELRRLGQTGDLFATETS